MKKSVKQRKWFTFLSVLLSVILLLQSGAVAVSANALDQITTEPMAPIQDVNIISERAELRTEFEKHFVLSDGTYQAVAYADPVHEQLSDGSWQEIDNTLSLASGRYESGAANFKASFAANTSASKLVSVQSKGFDLSWSLTILKSNPDYQVMSVGAGEQLQAVQPSLSAAAVENPAYPAFSLMSDAQKIESAAATSNLTYANAFGNGINVEYGVRAYAVKENVILQNANTGFRGYKMQITANGLIAQKDEYNNITFSDSEGNVQFTIQAPYMLDAADNVSEDIAVSLTQTAAGYDISYIPNAQWLSAATYPVVIDPSVNSSQSSSNLIDTYTYEGDSTSNSSSRENLDRMYVGNKSVSGTRKKHIGYFKFKNLPNIPSGYAFQSASVNLRCPSGTSSSQPFDLYEVAEDWVTTNLTWNTKPDVLYRIYLAANRNTSTNNVYFAGLNSNRHLSITVGNWYNGAANNYGFMVCYTTASENYADYNGLYTSNCSTTDVRPYMTVNYELMNSAVSTGIYTIKNVSTGKYMTVAGNGASQSNVVAVSEPAGINHKWIVTKLSDGNYKISPLINPQVRLLNDASRLNDGNNISVHSGYYGMSMEFSISFALDSNGYPYTDRYRIGTRTTGSNSYVADVSGNVVQKNYAANNNQVWKFEVADPAISIPSSLVINKGSTSAVPVTYYPASATTQTIIWSSSNTSVATINSSGRITGVNPGKCTITATTDSGQTLSCNVMVGISDLTIFNTLLSDNLIQGSDIINTNDGFYMLTKSLGDILISGGVSYLIDSTSENYWCNNYYDDWYIYAVLVDDEYIYSLLKMREKENDQNNDLDGDGNADADSDDPGVTISFVEFLPNKMIRCIQNPSNENKLDLYTEISTVIGPEKYDHSTDLTSYFKQASAVAPYLIVNTYINFIASTSENGKIALPNAYNSILNEIANIENQLENPNIDPLQAEILDSNLSKLRRIPNRLAEINQLAGYTIFDASDNSINISNPVSLTAYEKYAILAAFTANVIRNSFAAEVVYHADMADLLLVEIGDNSIDVNIFNAYKSAIRADMGLGEEIESGPTDSYYDLDSSLVTAQIEIHGYQ